MFRFKKDIYLIATTVLLILSTQGLPVNAQSPVNNTTNTTGERAISNCVVTKVGNPAISPSLPPECETIMGDDDLIKAALAIKVAFDSCKAFGFTYAGSDTCIADSLKASGYSDGAIQAFAKKRPNTIVGYPIPCTQCLGFVGLSLALATGDSSSLSGFGAARNVLAINSFKAGPSLYVRVGGTISEQHTPKPGDIGVAGVYAGEGIGEYGHILIVKEVKAGNIKFTAVESNWGLPGCRVSDGVSHISEIYIFYRKQ